MRHSQIINPGGMPEVSPVDSQSVTLRLTRIGHTFGFYYQLPGGDFILHREVERADFPAEIQVGLVTYTDFPNTRANDEAGSRHHNANIPTGVGTNPDLLAKFAYARFEGV